MNSRATPPGFKCLPLACSETWGQMLASVVLVFQSVKNLSKRVVIHFNQLIHVKLVEQSLACAKHIMNVR